MEIKKITSTLLASNTYILIKDNSSIIIDSGAKLEDVIKTTQGTKVEGIFLTHGHYDHSFNSIKYSKNFNCKIFASKEIAETLSNPSKNYGDDFKINNFEDFIFFDKEGTINTPNFEIKTYNLPGHSKCSVGYLIDDIFFCGDVLFKRGIGRTDLFGGNKAEMLSSLKKINNINFKLIKSGHGEESFYNEQIRNLSTFIKFLSR